LVDALVFLGEMELPVAVEVAVGDQGAEFEDGLGALQAPAGAGDVEPVADQVAGGVGSAAQRGSSLSWSFSTRPPSE